MIRINFRNVADCVCSTVRAEIILPKVFCTYRLSACHNLSRVICIYDLEIIELRFIPVIDWFNIMYILFIHYFVPQWRFRTAILFQLILIRWGLTPFNTPVIVSYIWAAILVVCIINVCLGDVDIVSLVRDNILGMETSVGWSMEKGDMRYEIMWGVAKAFNVSSITSTSSGILQTARGCSMFSCWLLWWLFNMILSSSGSWKRSNIVFST